MRAGLSMSDMVRERRCVRMKVCTGVRVKGKARESRAWHPDKDLLKKKKIMRLPPRARSRRHTFPNRDPSVSSSTFRLVSMYDTGAQLYHQDRRGSKGRRASRRSDFHVDLAPRTLRTFRSTLRPSSLPVPTAIGRIRVDSKRASLRACGPAQSQCLDVASEQVGPTLRGVSVRRTKKISKLKIIVIDYSTHSPSRHVRHESVGTTTSSCERESVFKESHAGCSATVR